MVNIILETNRLILRNYCKSDFNILKNLFTNKDVMRYCLYEIIENENKLNEFVNSIISNDNEIKDNKKSYEYAVIEKTTKQYIGIAIIDVVEKYNFNIGEIGYLLLPEFWGKGYGTEVAKLLLNNCFEVFNFPKVIANCNANNKNSEKVMKKIGMKFECRLINERLKDNEWVDEIRYYAIKS